MHPAKTASSQPAIQIIHVNKDGSGGGIMGII